MHSPSLPFAFDSVPCLQDAYKHFLKIARVYRLVTAMKRSGQAHGIDQYLTHRPAGNLIVYCPACPEPGVNMPPTRDIGRVPPELR